MDSKYKIIKYIRWIFYFLSIMCILSYVGGIVYTLFFNLKIESSKIFFNLTEIVPFCLSAWLLLLGLIFVKKNWKVVILLLLFFIVHAGVCLIAYSLYGSVIDVLKFYLTIFSFGVIKIM